MLRHIRPIFVLGAWLVAIFANAGQPIKEAANVTHEPDIYGQATNGLQPVLFCDLDAGWCLQLAYRLETNVPDYTWLRITNNVGAKLQLWLTNGVEVRTTNVDVLDTAKLPLSSTVTDVMRGYPGGRSRRGMQWMDFASNASAAGAYFCLQDVFHVSVTNDVILQITPLIYRVETNKETANLIEFAPIKVKLLANGKIEKVQSR